MTTNPQPEPVETEQPEAPEPYAEDDYFGPGVVEGSE